MLLPAFNPSYEKYDVALSGDVVRVLNRGGLLSADIAVQTVTRGSYKSRYYQLSWTKHISPGMCPIRGPWLKQGQRVELFAQYLPLSPASKNRTPRPQDSVTPVGWRIAAP